MAVPGGSLYSSRCVGALHGHVAWGGGNIRPMGAIDLTDAELATAATA
jgi:hypothetical protein